jgi:ABC-type Fe3+/spermidine/putrescine transport system ATPase subunit
MAVMEKGLISQVGSPREVYRAPLSTGVASFIGEANFFQGSYQGHGTVQSPHGLWNGRLTDPSWSPAQGDAVVLCVRPESLRFSPAPADLNSLSGTLTESIYLGELAQYAVTAGPSSFRLAELNPAGLRPSGPDAVHLTASPDDVMILRP